MRLLRVGKWPRVTRVIPVIRRGLRFCPRHHTYQDLPLICPWCRRFSTWPSLMPLLAQTLQEDDDLFVSVNQHIGEAAAAYSQHVPPAARRVGKWHHCSKNAPRLAGKCAKVIMFGESGASGRGWLVGRTIYSFHFHPLYPFLCLQTLIFTISAVW